VIFVAPYLGGAFCTVERIADHIEHVAAVAGEDAVALGSDFDGFLPLPRGLRDAADLPRLTQLLWQRGWRPPQLRKLLGENALRFFDRPAVADLPSARPSAHAGAAEGAATPPR
jgi:membrane dipeptidase